jgi:ribosome-binding ATPase YchF (GTP1/OBG family)
VAAEVTPWEALVEAGGYTPARERALTRVEGRDYVMQDGDVATFRFTPS